VFGDRWFEILIGFFVKIEIHEHGGQGEIKYANGT
jgi:hypothetical protein